MMRNERLAERVWTFMRGLPVCALVSSLGLAACATPSRVATSPQPGRALFKVLTYNVNFGLPSDGPGLKAILDADADVVFLQETNEGWETGLRAVFAKRYPHMQFQHCCRAGGLAVLSKWPLAKVDILSSEAEGSWFPAMRVEVEGPGGRLEV